MLDIGTEHIQAVANGVRLIGGVDGHVLTGRLFQTRQVARVGIGIDCLENAK